MAEISVPVRIELLLTDAINDAKGAADAIEKQLGGISSATKSITDLGKAFGSFFVVDLALQAIGSLKDKVGDFVKEAAEAQKISVDLANALKLSGSYSEAAVENFKDLSEALAETTKFDDDLILSQFKIAKQFSTSNAEAEKLVEAATELATVLNEDLGTATEQLGKTLDGTAGRLNETLPGLRQFSKEALVSGAAIDYVLSRFGGSAEKDVETFSGQLAQVNKATLDLEKSIGRLVVNNEAFTKILKLAADGLKALEGVINDNSDAITSFIDAGLKTVVDLLGVFVLTIEELDKVLTVALIPINVFARTLQAIFGGLGSLLTLDLKGLAENLNIVGNVGKDNAQQKAAFEQRAASYDKIAEAAAKASNYLGDQLSTTTQINKASKERADNDTTAAASAARLAIALHEQVLAFRQSTANFGLDALTQIAIERETKLGALNALHVTALEYAYQEAKINQEYDKKRYEERQKQLSDLTKNPFGAPKPGETNRLGLTDGAQNGIATGIGIGTQVLQGRQGAINLISQGAEAAGQAFLGVPGLGSIVGLLAQGPEAVKGFVKEFVASVPDIITAIVESIPAIIDGLIDALPDFINALVNDAPKIAIATAKAMSIYLPEAIAKAIGQALAQFFDQLAKGAERFVDEIIKGAGQFIDKLIQGLSDGLSKVFDGLNPFSGSSSGAGGLVSGIGNVIGNIGGAIGSVFGFKEGNSDGGGFTKSYSPQGSSNGGAMVIQLQVGQKQLASTILDLNKQGFRTV